MLKDMTLTIYNSFEIGISRFFQFSLFVTLVFLAVVSLTELSGRIDLYIQIKNKISNLDKSLSSTAKQVSNINGTDNILNIETPIEFYEFPQRYVSNPSSAINVNYPPSDIINRLNSVYVEKRNNLTIEVINLSQRFKDQAINFEGVNRDNEFEYLQNLSLLTSKVAELKEVIARHENINAIYDTAIRTATEGLKNAGVPEYNSTEDNDSKNSDFLYERLRRSDSIFSFNNTATEATGEAARLFITTLNGLNQNKQIMLLKNQITDMETKVTQQENSKNKVVSDKKIVQTSLKNETRESDLDKSLEVNNLNDLINQMDSVVSDLVRTSVKIEKDYSSELRSRTERLNELHNTLENINASISSDSTKLSLLDSCLDSLKALSLSGRNNGLSSRLLQVAVNNIINNGLPSEKSSGGQCNRSILSDEELDQEKPENSFWPRDLVTGNSTDSLLAILLVCAGMLGSLIIGFRRSQRFRKQKYKKMSSDFAENEDQSINSTKVESELGNELTDTIRKEILSYKKRIMQDSIGEGLNTFVYSLVLGAGAGFVLFLGIKGGAHVLLSHISANFVALNPYTSAFLGLLAGMFTEKIYDFLAIMTDKAIESLKNGLS